MGLVILTLIFSLEHYLEIRECRIERFSPRHERVLNGITLLLITFIGVVPKLINGQYETIYLAQFAIILSILIVVAKIDFEEEVITNEIVLLILSINCLFLLIEIFSNVKDAKVIIVSAFVGFLTGGGIFILVNILQKNGIGAGDIKLFAVLGIPLGLVGIISICLNTFIFAAISSLILLRFKEIKKDGRIPLAPFILLATLLYG